jgi:hypothetical protein
MVAAVRKILIFFGIVILIAVAIGAFLLFTTPQKSAGIRVPLDTRERALIARVPASAEVFAIIPTAAALDGKLRANPITGSAIAKWSERHPLPRPWMIGGSDLILWRRGDETHYLVEPDPLRAMVVRLFGSSIAINSTGEPPLDSATVSQIADLAAHLPPGDALVVQRESSHGAYPPLARPAVTSVAIGDSDITMTSVATADVGRALARPDVLKPVLHFPRSAILSAAFAQPPRIIGDLNRLFGAKISTLFEDGGTLCIYNIDTHKLLPRPMGVIVLPNDPQRRAILDSFRKAEAIGIRIRTAEIGDTLALAFDDSIDLYQKDVFDEAPAANQWAMRIDPQRLVPILNDLEQNIGLRIAAPRLYRSVRDLGGWIGELEQAKTIEATDSADSGVETLHVRISAK